MNKEIIKKWNKYSKDLEDYGSCSGCDTLQRISNYSDDKPNKEQLKDYMTLSLHLIQKMKVMVDNND